MASSPKGIFLTFGLKKKKPNDNLTNPELEIYEYIDSHFTKTTNQKKNIETLGSILKEDKLVVGADIRTYTYI